MKKIYLACPYSHDDPKVRESRFKSACVATAILMIEGNVVFSPISHSHSVAEIGGLRGEGLRFWLLQDMPFVEWCDELHVLMLDGWKESEGVNEEIAQANAMNKTVEYLIPQYQIRELVRESEDDSNCG